MKIDNGILLPITFWNLNNLEMYSIDILVPKYLTTVFSLNLTQFKFVIMYSRINKCAKRTNTFFKTKFDQVKNSV